MKTHSTYRSFRATSRIVMRSWSTINLKSLVPGVVEVVIIQEQLSTSYFKTLPTVASFGSGDEHSVSNKGNSGSATFPKLTKILRGAQDPLTYWMLHHLLYLSCQTTQKLTCCRNNWISFIFHAFQLVSSQTRTVGLAVWSIFSELSMYDVKLTVPNPSSPVSDHMIMNPSCLKI